MRKGFTLVEVCIVIVILLILAGISYSVYTDVKQKRDFISACIADGVKEYVCKERAEVAYRREIPYAPVYVR